MIGRILRRLQAWQDASPPGYLSFLADQLDPPHGSPVERAAARRHVRDDVIARLLREQAHLAEATTDLHGLLGCVLAIAMALQATTWIFLFWWINR